MLNQVPRANPWPQINKAPARQQPPQQHQAACPGKTDAATAPPWNSSASCFWPTWPPPLSPSLTVSLASVNLPLAPGVIEPWLERPQCSKGLSLILVMCCVKRPGDAIRTKHSHLDKLRDRGRGLGHMTPGIPHPRKPAAGARGPNGTQIRTDYGSTEIQIRFQVQMMLETPGRVTTPPWSFLLSSVQWGQHTFNSYLLST